MFILNGIFFRVKVPFKQAVDWLFGSCDEYRTTPSSSTPSDQHNNTKQQHTLRPTQHTWAVCLPVCCCHLLPPLPFVYIFSVSRVGPGHPSSPLVHLLPHLFPRLLFSFFHWLYLFSSFVHPLLSTRIVPLRFQAGGRRRRLNVGLVCVLLCNLCYLYSLV